MYSINTSSPICTCTVNLCDQWQPGIKLELKGVKYNILGKLDEGLITSKGQVTKARNYISNPVSIYMNYEKERLRNSQVFKDESLTLHAVHDKFKGKRSKNMLPSTSCSVPKGSAERYSCIKL